MVVNDVVSRIRQRRGWYYAHEWERFADHLGVTVWRCDLPLTVPAFLHGDCMYLSRYIEPQYVALVAWHELAHHVLHAGGPCWWLTRPQGYITVARFERQADEFAATFPIWDEQADPLQSR